MIESFSIDDPICNPLNDCIEVTVKLKGHRKRWCFFVTSQWISDYLFKNQDYKSINKDGLNINQFTVIGKLIENCKEPFEIIAVPHMIVVREIREDIIYNTLKYLDEDNEILSSTRML